MTVQAAQLTLSAICDGTCPQAHAMATIAGVLYRQFTERCATCSGSGEFGSVLDDTTMHVVICGDCDGLGRVPAGSQRPQEVLP